MGIRISLLYLAAMFCMKVSGLLSRLRNWAHTLSFRFLACSLDISYTSSSSSSAPVLWIQVYYIWIRILEFAPICIGIWALFTWLHYRYHFKKLNKFVLQFIFRKNCVKKYNSTSRKLWIKKILSFSRDFFPNFNCVNPDPYLEHHVHDQWYQTHANQ